MRDVEGTFHGIGAGRVGADTRNPKRRLLSTGGEGADLKLPLAVGVVPVAGRCTSYLPTEMKQVSERAEEDEEEHKNSFFIMIGA